MSVLTLNVNEVMRTLSAESSSPFVTHDKEVDIVRFAINSGFADIVLDGQVALRVMYQRPGETEVRAQTLTYYDTDGLHNYYDWQLSQSDLAKNGSLMVALCILRTDSEVEEWHTTPCQIRVLDTIHTDDSDEGDETITPTVAQRVAVLESMIQRVASGAPIVVSSTSAMTDTSQIYVLSTDGMWYYYDGSVWAAGGEYGAVSTDTTLTQPGVPADAKVVGDEIADLKSDLDAISGTTDNIFDMSVFDGVEGITKETNGSYTGTALAFNNAFAQGVPGLTFEANKQYFLSFLAYTDGNQGTEANNGLQFSLYKSDNTRIGRKSVLNSQTTEALFTVFSTAGNTVSHMTIGYSGNGYNIWHIRNIMLCASSVPVDYIPHVTANDSVARNKVKDSIFITDISGNKISGAYINLQRKVVGDTVDLTPTANTSMSHAIEECNTGDAYIITTTGLSAGLPYAFIDANNVITEIRNIDPLNIAEYSVIAPTDGKLIVNSVNNATFSLIKVTNAQTAEKINEAQFLRTLSSSIRWKGKKIVVFGDSRTWYDGHLYTENTKSELRGSVCVGYQEQMRKLMMAQVENQGVSGETSAQICARIRAFDFTGYDAVLLEGGVNDFVKSSSVAIGQLAPIGSAFDTSTVYGAWQSAIEYILTNYPSVLIYMDIPAIAWIHQANDVFPYDTAKIKGEIADLYNIPCLDLYKTSGINVVNRDYWYCDDVASTNWRLHFNDFGNALVGAKIAEFMIAN